MNTNVGQRVYCVFNDTRNHDEVTEMIFHEAHTQYMYRVVYEDDDTSWILEDMGSNLSNVGDDSIK